MQNFKNDWQWLNLLWYLYRPHFSRKSIAIPEKYTSKYLWYIHHWNSLIYWWSFTLFITSKLLQAQFKMSTCNVNPSLLKHIWTIMYIYILFLILFLTELFLSLIMFFLICIFMVFLWYAFFLVYAQFNSKKVAVWPSGLNRETNIRSLNNCRWGSICNWNTVLCLFKGLLR